MRLHLTTANSGEFAVVSAVGELDLATSPQLRNALDALVSDGARDIVVDLAGVTFLDSSALSVLIGQLKTLVRLGGRLSVMSAPDHIARVFAVTGLHQVLPMWDDLSSIPALDEARLAVGGRDRRAP